MHLGYVDPVHLEELSWFLGLAETEHVTDAAAELGVSQPTLSSQRSSCPTTEQRADLASEPPPHP
jgi:hypothetical protein